MNVLLAYGTEEQRDRIAAVIGDGREVALIEEAPTDHPWHLAVVMLDGSKDMAAAIGKVRSRIGAGPVLIGITGHRQSDPRRLLKLGLDDVADTLDAFLDRYPFLVARLRQRAHRQLRVNAIMESTVDGIVVIDQAGIISSVNPAVTRIFGYPEEEVLGQNVTMLMPNPYAAEHDGYISRYLATGVPHIIGIGREVSGLRKDGSVFPLDLAVSETRLEGASAFVGVVRDISDRRRLENEVLRVSEDERRRIGQDLHDGLGQMLTGIGLIAQNLGRGLRDEGHSAAGDVEEIVDLIREADEQARLLARGLVPVELDREGLPAALRDLCSKAERLFGGTCHFTTAEDWNLEDATAATNLFRIAQEAVSNAFKHGRADRVEMSLVVSPTAVGLRVLDNGIGFPEELPEERGMGVRIMHYRAGVVGGQLQIRARPDGGTVVSCDIPRSHRAGTHPKV